MGTFGIVFTPHMLLLPKKTRPQLTLVWVAMTTLSIAADTCDHFEQPGVLQAAPVASSFMESDLSCTIRMSGGSGMMLTFVWPQLIPPVPVGVTSPPPPPLPPPPDRPNPPLPPPPPPLELPPLPLEIEPPEPAA